MTDPRAALAEIVPRADYVIERLAERGVRLVTEAEQMRWRALLWEHHGHEGIYGDDGEMQCRGVDFKRDPIEVIERHLSPLLAALSGEVTE